MALAIAVLLGHASDHSLFGFRMMDPAYAVEAFFMLSGFYMSLVLDTSYRGRHAYRVFITNRLLRLYPIYWIVLVLTILIVFYGTHFVDLPRDRPDILYNATFVFPQLLNLPALLLLIPSHLLMLGQDVVYFFAIDPHGLYSIRDYAARQAAVGSSVPLFSFLMLPQAWSLSFELLFYAMAPSLVRRSNATILGLLAASLALRAWMQFDTSLMTYTAWSYKFFPVEFWTFTAGILMYRAYRVIRARGYGTTSQVTALAVAIGTALFFSYLPGMRNWVLFTVIAVTIPFTFPLFARDGLDQAARWRQSLNHLDSLLGDLSYPVYITHVFVLHVAYTFAAGAIPQLGSLVTPLVTVATLGFSYVLLRAVSGPVDRYRNRNKESLSQPEPRAERRRRERSKRRRARPA